MFNDISLIDRHYQHFEQLRDDAMGWELDFRQTGAGEQGHKLVQLARAGFGLVYCEFNSPYDQRSASPKHLRTFSILADQRAPSTWCGQKFEWNSLVSFPIGDEFRALSTGHFSNYVFSLSEELLARTANGQFHSDWEAISQASQSKVFQLSDPDMRQLRSVLRTLTAAATAPQADMSCQPFIADLAERIVAGLLNASPAIYSRAATNRRKHFLVAQDYIDAYIDSPLVMRDICEATGVSQRTLEYAFREQGGLTPKAYLIRQRLSRVHQALTGQLNDELRIADVANQWGFWHMGQFARDYRKVYRVNPSETLASKAIGK